MTKTLKLRKPWRIFSHKNIQSVVSLLLAAGFGYCLVISRRSSNLKSPRKVDSSGINEDNSFQFRRSLNKSEDTDNIKDFKASDTSNCPITVQGVQWNSKPLICLDKSKFILPILINGPNNQLAGFRKTIFEAIRLNRTVVMPKFQKHNQHDSSGEIAPEHRIDLDYLRKFIHVVSLDEFRRSCHGNIDAVFRVMSMTSKMYRNIEKTIGMKILNEQTNGVLEYPLQLSMASKINEKFISYQPSEIKRLYKSQEKCALHPNVFASLRVRAPKQLQSEPNQVLDLKKMSDVDLYGEIIRFTRQPSHVREMAQEFCERVLSDRPYISVHWRFDKKDWMRRCLAETPWGTLKRRKMCQEILEISAEDIAMAISKKNDASVMSKYVYIASPPGVSDLVDDVAEILFTRYDLKTFTADDLIKFWKQRYGSCEWLWSNKVDLLSSTEMEICRRSSVFLRSGGSTWSGNVHHGRSYITSKLLAHDGHIFAAAKEAHELNKKI